jgi:hypothetical protein
MSDIDPRLVSAVDHMQKAALELIAAMRNALDVAEDMVADPAALQVLIQGAVIAAKTATDAATSAAASAAARVTSAPAPTADRVERIRIDD